ncbi:putative DNA primase/helicase [Flavobacterium sp. CG_9.10]|uniref:DNA primase family protein n=1 Tax=Flavobacterium sp. CG_9.10 TaxID=2787729 RepID=UPI0018CBDCDD|nr:phage/plasmid primase, P4 family [Flavobacterium sp. CG_9.10]MBG6110794.1 putative DNA primase/helicase [Flavobacterium sp. CG_9.10]
MDSTSILTTAQSSDSDKDTNNLENAPFTEDNFVEQSNSVVTLPKTADEIFQELIKGVEKIDFESLAFNGNNAEQKEEYKPLEDNESVSLNEEEISEKGEKSVQKEQLKKLSSFVLTKNHYIIICVEELINIAKRNNWGLCKKNGFIYLYNGAYWSEIDKEQFQFFLGEVALKMGVEKFKGKIHTFKSDLFRQFMSDAFLTTPKSNKDEVLINLQNGTFEITPANRGLRNFDQKDFLTHQLSFEYDTVATAPLFQKYLDEVLPDKDKQKVLAEYMGYIFIKTGILKLEKVLMLFGAGANGKSVFFEIISALLGSENMSNYSLQSLTNENGYHRAKLSGKLLNYASEIHSNFETSIFKQLASGEPIEARLPYGDPFTLNDYAKLMFNCNELPKEVEQTNAFFRRFLIMEFDVTIPESKQDKELSKKIIETELSGVFNWVLEGLDRLLIQKNFSKCAAIDNARSEYEKQSDSVQLFINENGFEKSATKYILISEMHKMYKSFCIEDNYKPLGKSKFIQRLNHLNLFVDRLNVGNVVYLTEAVPKT